jgi:hypothetical protein
MKWINLATEDIDYLPLLDELVSESTWRDRQPDVRYICDQWAFFHRMTRVTLRDKTEWVELVQPHGVGNSARRIVASLARGRA